MPRTKGPKKIKQSPDEFKIIAVKLADHPDILAKDVAEDLGFIRSFFTATEKSITKANSNKTAVNLIISYRPENSPN